eukprot:403360353
MSDSCSQCNNFFNLSNRKPIFLDDYGCTWCLECINFHLKDNPKREIYCPEDKEMVTLPEVLRENRLIMRKLQSLDQLTVFCDDHAGQTTTMYCSKCEIPACNYCKLDTHKEHQLIDLKQSNFKTYTGNVLRLLDEYSVENIKSQLLQLSTNQSQLKSSQFKELINKVKRMLNSLVSEEEYQQIDLAVSMEDPQNNPQNRQRPQRSNVNISEEQKTQNNSNIQNIQELIKESQSQLREEFKQQLEAFEINQNQINNQNNESFKLIKIDQDNFVNKTEELKKDIQSNLFIRCEAFENALEITKSQIINLEQTCHQLQDLNNDYSQKQQLLETQLDNSKKELTKFVLSIKTDIDKHSTLLVDVKNQIDNEKALLDTLQLKIQEVNDIKPSNSLGNESDKIMQQIVYNLSISVVKLNDLINKTNKKDDKDITPYFINGEELMRHQFRQLVDFEVQQMEDSLLQKQISDYSTKQFNLLYRGSCDGFTASKFHQLCDDKGPTICFILSEYGFVFGGFTSLPWTSPDSYKSYSDPSAFVFSLKLDVYIWKWC